MKSLHAVFAESDEAARAVEKLKHRGFSEDELTVVARADEKSEREAQQQQKSAREVQLRGGAWTGSLLGGAVAGSLGLLSYVLLPALPLVIVSGAAVGGAVGSATGRGVVEDQIRHAEKVLERGGALVFVHGDDPERLEQASKVLERSHADTVSATVSVEA